MRRCLLRCGDQAKRRSDARSSFVDIDEADAEGSVERGIGIGHWHEVWFGALRADRFGVQQRYECDKSGEKNPVYWRMTEFPSGFH